MSDETTDHEARRKAAWDVIADTGLPKGHVVRVLQEEGIDSAVIDRVATRLVPYTYT
jgi:hypothetical protein